MTVVEGDQKAPFPFQQLQHRCVGEGVTPFPGLLHFTLDPYLIMLSVKQGDIKYHFLSSYDTAGDWTPVSPAIGEHSTHQIIRPVFNLITIKEKNDAESEFSKKFTIYTEEIRNVVDNVMDSKYANSNSSLAITFTF